MAKATYTRTSWVGPPTSALSSGKMEAQHTLHLSWIWSYQLPYSTIHFFYPLPVHPATMPISRCCHAVVNSAVVKQSLISLKHFLTRLLMASWDFEVVKGLPKSLCGTETKAFARSKKITHRSLLSCFANWIWCQIQLMCSRHPEI